MAEQIHTPVLLERTLELLSPAISRPGAVVVDCTLGMGGHSEAMLEAFPDLTVVGLDRDTEALALAGARLAPFGDRARLVHTTYDGIAEALEAEPGAPAPNPTAAAFRTFAEQTKSDLSALAACMRGSRQTLSRAEVAQIDAPTLVTVGTLDTVSGSGPALVALMPNAKALELPDRDHSTAVGDRGHRAGVLAFLDARA